jgi:rhodanese-related sulfurtransferase
MIVGKGEESGRDTLFDRLAVVGKAFASAKRLELIDLLAQGERTVDALARETGTAVSTTSAHLQVLKLSNLVASRREGTKIHYRLAGDDVVALFAAMRAVARTHSADVDRALSAYLGDADLGAVAQISREELRTRLTAAEVELIDVRPVEEYRAGHIPGARSIPFGHLESHLHEIAGFPEVVVYCRGAYCVMGHDAVRLLEASGIEARRLQDGMLEWRTSGLPVTTG